jgi:predicted RNA binding protein with dsRBD fold (UPF0201 family)
MYLLFEILNRDCVSNSKKGLFFISLIKVSVSASLQISLSTITALISKILVWGNVSFLKNIKVKFKYSLISFKELLKFLVPKTSRLFFIKI